MTAQGSTRYQHAANTPTTARSIDAALSGKVRCITRSDGNFAGGPDDDIEPFGEMKKRQAGNGKAVRLEKIVPHDLGLCGLERPRVMMNLCPKEIASR